MFCCLALLTGLGVLTPGLTRWWRVRRGAVCRQCPDGGRRRPIRLRAPLAAAMVVMLVGKASADDPRALEGVMWFDSICLSTPASLAAKPKPEWLD